MHNKKEIIHYLIFTFEIYLHMVQKTIHYIDNKIISMYLLITEVVALYTFDCKNKILMKLKQKYFY